MLVQHPFLNRYHRSLVSIIIVLSGLFLFALLPQENQYYKDADEGNYYRQGKILADNGFSGFKKMTDIYLTTPSLQDAPHPLRIGAMVATGIVLSVHDSYRAISIFCILNFMLLLGGTFYFVKKFWGWPLAMLTVLLMAVSPLELAMARRALMDIPAMTGMAFSCFACWLWINKPVKEYLIALIAFMSWSILLKEASVILLPFFGIIMLYKKRKKETTASLLQIFIAVTVPGILVFVFYLLAFGYNDLMALFSTLHKAASHSAYSALWGKGPWYRIIIDYTLLSPYTLILAVGYTGYFLLKGEQNANTTYILLIALYLLICFGILPKNVRYGILLDIPIRLIAACALSSIFALVQKKRSWFPGLLLLLLAVADISAFHTYFIDGEIYDPISFNLLRASKIIPALEFIIPSQ